MADLVKKAFDFSIEESFGEVGVKQRLMTSYKEKYSRRNAFRAEMKKYGWWG